MYHITAESTMSDADLKFNQQEAVISLTPWIRQSDLASEQLVLTGCIPDLGVLLAAEQYRATFRADRLSEASEAAPPATDGGDTVMRESVSRFGSIGAAIVAYATIEAAVVDCPHGRSYTRDEGSSGYLEEWIDEALITNM